MSTQQDHRRVVVTGLGAITPSGNSADALWQAVRDGRSAIRVLEGDEFADLPVRIGGQVRDFDPTDHLPRALARRLSPVQQWAIAAADQALAQVGATGPDDLPWDPVRVSVLSASGSGPIDAMQAATRAYDEGGPRSVPLTLAIHGAPDGAGALLSQRYGIRGTAPAVSATCASGGIALGEGMRLIRHGYADAVLVVGMEDCLGPINLSSNANMRALAAGYEDDPASASRPFDRARSGFVMRTSPGIAVRGHSRCSRASAPRATPTTPPPRTRPVAGPPRRCARASRTPASTRRTRRRPPRPSTT